MAVEKNHNRTLSSKDDEASSHHPRYPYPYNLVADDEIDISELIGVVWRGKWIIAGITTIFAFASLMYALSLPNIYQSYALLAPSNDARGGGMSRMASQLGGLASLAGITMGGSAGDDKIAVAMAVLNSRKFIAQFIEKHGILPELMAAEDWDRDSNKLIFDEDLYSPEEKKWIRVVEPPKEPKPSDWEAYKAFKNILSITRDNDTGFVTVEVEHVSPAVAKNWVGWLVGDVNAVMKEKDMNEAHRSIKFLEGQLAGVALADMRTVFYQLIEEQTKTIMLAEVRDEYVFTIIDPPVLAEEKVKPKRLIILVLGCLVGGALSMIIVFMRHFIFLNKNVDKT